MTKGLMVTQSMKYSTCNKGFTLIELLIALVVGSLLLAATIAIFKAQQDHYTAQLDVTEMQQNIRGALNIIARDTRMAGYNSVGLKEARIVDAKSDLFHFTVDINEDGDVNDTGENIAYDRYFSATAGKWVLGRTTSSNSIVIVDKGGGHWEVDGSGGNPVHMPAAENIEHLEFLYLDKDGDVTADVEKIQTVVITIVAQASSPDQRFSNNQTYTPASNLTRYVNPAALSGITWTKGDNFRRRLQTMAVVCRNVGI